MFEWDARKAAINAAKHGVSIDDAVLMVAYTVRRKGHVEAIRLISARRASRREREAYHAEG